MNPAPGYWERVYSLDRLLARLDGRGVRVSLGEDGRTLALNVPASSLDPSDAAELRCRALEVVRRLIDERRRREAR